LIEFLNSSLMYLKGNGLLDALEQKFSA
jgi:hypothetical protein